MRQIWITGVKIDDGGRGWSFTGAFESRELAVADCQVAGQFLFPFAMNTSGSCLGEPEDFSGFEFPSGCKG